MVEIKNVDNVLSCFIYTPRSFWDIAIYLQGWLNSKRTDVKIYLMHNM